MKNYRRIFICISMIAVCLMMSSCNSGDEAVADNTSGDAAAPSESKDAYEEYIRNALANVEQNGSPAADTTNTPGRPETAVTVDRDASPVDTEPMVSSMESPDYTDDPFAATSTPAPVDDTATPTPTDDVSPSPTVDPNAPTPTPYITPEEFDVGTCCIYINGESDAAYGTEIVTAINKIRKDLGYTEFKKNKSLDACADRRTREIAANYSHTRPNGLPFYSVAPEHFKAEMLIVNNQKGEETADVLIKRDPISRNLIFTNKYQSIGASSFKCNGVHYTVISFGL